mmetsp:Transcript_54546/g.170458  ORF Transcript_54546/g.170458 Transcript_54546/m.170458 type:complete len:244 (-) Transcript_54546:105-836(-)
MTGISSTATCTVASCAASASRACCRPCAVESVRMSPSTFLALLPPGGKLPVPAEDPARAACPRQLGRSAETFSPTALACRRRSPTASPSAEQPRCRVAPSCTTSCSMHAAVTSRWPSSFLFAASGSAGSSSSSPPSTSQLNQVLRGAASASAAASDCCRRWASAKRCWRSPRTRWEASRSCEQTSSSRAAKPTCASPTSRQATKSSATARASSLRSLESARSAKALHNSSPARWTACARRSAF